MKTTFRTYQSLHSSIFSLINGTTEVKQTIALAYLFANESPFLKAFLKLKVIKNLLGKVDLKQKIGIHAEMISISEKRADIVLMFYKDKRPHKAIIIEAKGISVNPNSRSAFRQLREYIEEEEFPLLKGFDTVGCLLTKYPLVSNHTKMTAITWDEIFTLLSKHDGLCLEYLQFLSQINGTMNFYEKEVYSIPAGRSWKLQYEYPFIYECPNHGRNYTSIKKPLYFAFRRTKGIMNRLFGMEQNIILNPATDFDLFMGDPSYSTRAKQRVKDYCETVWGAGNYPDDEKQFFILSESNQIELPHEPRPPANNAFRAYYKLSTLLNADNLVVESDG